MIFSPGSIALMGSGETTAHGGQVFDRLVRGYNSPVNIRLLGTPAGFELNSDEVIGRVASYLVSRLQNYQPDVKVISARRRDGPAGTEAIETAERLLDADLIFMGPGSPTYLVRHLRNTKAWSVVLAAQRCGASLALASAATVSAGVLTLPVYEIFKAGEDPRWTAGLDLFSFYGLPMVIIPHWNNREGGANLDTSHCFIGEERFSMLEKQLSDGISVLGLDEHTSVILDLNSGYATVYGRNQIHIRKRGLEKTFSRGEVFPLSELGDFRLPLDWQEDIPDVIWASLSKALGATHDEDGITPPPQVLQTLESRARAREARDWVESDRLRDLISAMGWRVVDTPDGQKLERA